MAHCLSVLYALDLLSITPKLRIFNHSTYTTTFSLILSIIIILISIGFSLFLLIDFFSFENPFVVYTKENDKITNRTIKVKDTFFIFGLLDSYTFQPIMSEAFYTSVYAKIFFNGTIDITPITLEICEFGKNIDMKYKKLFEENKILEIYHSNISDYYCISSKYENLSVAYLPNIGEFSIVAIPYIYNHSKYIPENILSLFITEQDLIEHNNRDNPLNNYYALSRIPNYGSKEITSVNIDLQYIKYETDTQLFLRNYKKIDAKTFVTMEYFKDYIGEYDFKNQPMGEIKICMKDFFDHYKRSYPKLPAVLTQILVIIYLLFGIGQKICDILLTKKMAKDIVGNILNHKEYINENENDSCQQELVSSRNYQSEVIFKEKCKSITINQINSKDKSLGEKDNTDIKNGNNFRKKEIESKFLNSKRFEKITNFDIIRSFCCCENKKTRLINKCYNIINKDICLDNIINKIYELDNIYSILSKNEQNRVKMNQNIYKRFNDVNHLFNQIYFGEEFGSKKSKKKRNTII